MSEEGSGKGYEVPNMNYVVSIFKIMSDETRLSILWLLSRNEWCVHDIAHALGTSVSNISHHLRLLRASRLVKSRQEAKGCNTPSTTNTW